MARIPDDQVERLKREVSLEGLVSGKGIALSRKGRDLVGLCPFHNEDTPSLIVSPQKNLFHCMGCGAAGSVIDWVMRIEGISFRHAVELLLKDAFPLAASPSAALEEIKVLKRATIPKLDGPFQTEAEDEDLANQVIDFYHEKLYEQPDALAYLKKRGIDDPDLIARFKLGFADRTLGYRLPHSNRQTGAELRGRLQKLGFIRESGHEHFNGSIVVPIFDADGQVVQCYGRKINDNLRKGTAYHLYLPGEHRAVWNEVALADHQEIILCESLIDALTFWVHGYRNVTASFGIRGFLKEVHLAAFKKYGTEKVLIAYDRDEPGDRAATDLAAALQAAGIESARIQFPKGMDANSYACTMKPANKALTLLIRMAGGQVQPADEPSPAPAPPQQPPAAAKGKLLEPIPHEPTLMRDGAESGSFPLAAPPSAAELPHLPHADLKAVIKDDGIFMSRGDRSYRIRSLEQNLSRNVMKVNAMAYRGELFHMDVLNLYSAYHRSGFAKLAAKELNLAEEVIEKDLGRILLKLEEIQEAKIEETLKPVVPEMSENERIEALDLLQDPQLITRILSDFETCGIVGERTNKLVGYLVAISRKLSRPLGAMIQSSSAAGKTTTMDAILSFVPKEDLIKYSAITGQALYYKGENDLQHKIIAIVEEEGAEKASYPLKLLLSEGELIIASTGKNQSTGNHATQDYHVKGPVAVFVTTTSVDTDEEFQNRCLVLTVDESRSQTQAIHKAQREKHTLAGLKKHHAKDRILRQHQNAQRLLQPIHVVNPYARSLTFLDDKTRTRRDQEKYLNLIAAIAFLHQAQREIKSFADGAETIPYIEVTLADIALANELAHEVLGRSLDELPPQTRVLLGLIHQMVMDACTAQGLAQSDYLFSRREIRECIQWGNTQLKIHLKRLEDMELLLAHRGKRGQSFVYELLYQGEGLNEKPFLMGLLDVEKLKGHAYDGKKSGGSDQLAGPGRASVGPKSAPSQVGERSAKPLSSLPLAAQPSIAAENRERGYYAPGR